VERACVVPRDWPGPRTQRRFFGRISYYPMSMWSFRTPSEPCPGTGEYSSPIRCRAVHRRSLPDEDAERGFAKTYVKPDPARLHPLQRIPRDTFCCQLLRLARRPDPSHHLLCRARAAGHTT